MARKIEPGDVGKGKSFKDAKENLLSVADTSERRVLAALNTPVPATDAVRMLSSFLPSHPDAMLDVGKGEDGKRVVRVWSRPKA